MSKVWRELSDPTKHRDFMTYVNIGGVPVEKTKDNLIKNWVYFAEVKGFTFTFVGIDQVYEAKDYFSKKIHPSTRDPNVFKHWYFVWYCRLPRGLKKEVNRQLILKRLDEIISKWGRT
ncbi:hypothetical protein [Microbulbifer elongatus]|uniref:hypothetical protein n=1 Tax=Microbulbifer elongatus TaxID=86173 RepID=UPI001CFDEA0D|nr:hypothetical protein [Microbulbifer elongatus]